MLWMTLHEDAQAATFSSVTVSRLTGRGRRRLRILRRGVRIRYRW
jgi:hypothetical protein